MGSTVNGRIPKDDDRAPVLGTLSYLDGKTIVPIYGDPATGALLVENTGGSGGGTSSTFGAAFPTTGIAIGISNGTDMEPLLSTTAATVIGNITGANIAPIASGSDYYPQYNAMNAGGGQIVTDPSGAMVTRGATLTDEGTFRVNFTNSSLYVTSGFNATFTNGGYIVTFASSIAGILTYGSFIALSADGGAYTTIVARIVNSTTVELGASYAGTSATGTFIYGTVSESVGTGGSITVASGQATIATGTTNASQTYLYGPGGAAVSYYLESSFSISQREANQDIYFGFEASPFATITQFARFHFTSTTNTQVITETGYNPSGAPSSSEQETNTITLPSSATTATLQTYRMVVELDKIYFYVNGNLIATHSRRLPRQKDFLYQGATFGIRTLNGTGAATTTSVVVDYMFLRSYDRLDTNLLTTAASANGMQNSTTGTLLGVGIGGQYNSSLPTVTTGNYYVSQIDSNARLLTNTVPNASTSAAVPSNAMPFGINAVSANPTATTTTYSTIPIGNLTGKLVTLPYGIQETFQSGTASATGTSSTSLITAVTSNKIYLTSVQIMNTGSTTTYVNLQDGNGGTTKVVVQAPAGGGANITFPVPIANTAGNAWYFAAGNSNTTLYVSAQGYSEIT